MLDCFTKDVRFCIENFGFCRSFLTDISKAWDLEANNAAWKRSTALMRAGEPDEVVGAALYFASKASSFTTGSVLGVTGGSGGGGSGSADPAASANVKARM